MAVVEGPSAGKNAIDVVKRVDFFDLGRTDNFHMETDVVGDTFHVMKPIEIGLLTGYSDASGGVPADILSGFLFECRVQTIAIIMDFGEVVVTDQAGALACCMPSRARGKLPFFYQQNVGFAFLGQMVGQSHAHDSATDNNNLGLCFHSRSFPQLFLLRLP